jgi:two-component system, OmpR family, alkaline phosphatase synthesis response regulator PhoP
MEGKRLLVVDDEIDILDLLRDVLTSEGYVVDTAPSAEAALDLIHASIYDAAILDFNLPDMDGVMLHRQIRQKDPELARRSVFVSGLVQSDRNLGYYAAQGAGFLSKPFDIEDVLAAVRNLLGPAD